MYLYRSVKKCYLLFILLSIFLFLFAVIFTFLFLDANKKIKMICINDNCFKVEIVKNQKDKEKGLSFKESLPINAGMLFVYKKEDFYSFWMKDMNFSLDIIWINKNKKIVHIEKNVPPCNTKKCQKYRPTQKAMYVLEINSNLTEKLKIKKGDKIVLK